MGKAFDEVQPLFMIKALPKLGTQRNLLPWPVWLSWLEYHLVDQRVPGSIPSWGVYGRQPINVSFSCRCFSFSPSLSPPLSLPLPSFVSKTVKKSPKVRGGKGTSLILQRVSYQKSSVNTIFICKVKTNTFLQCSE